MQVIDYRSRVGGTPPGETDEGQGRLAALPHQGAEPHGCELTLPGGPDPGREPRFHGLGGDHQVIGIHVEALALGPLAGRLVGARPAGGQHVEQLLLDFVARIACRAGANQLDGARVCRAPDGQPVHLPQLAVRAQQRQESGDTPLHQDGRDQPGLALGQRPQRNRRIESAEGNLAQPLLESGTLLRDLGGRALGEPAGADVVEPRLALQHHRHAGQLVQSRQQGREPASSQCQLAQLAVQVLGALVELGPLVDDVAQDLLLDLVERQGGRQREQR